LNQALKTAQKRVASGLRSSAELIREAEESVLAAGGRIDYIRIVDSDSLEDAAEVDENSRMLMAVFFGNTRLIDNCSLIT